MAEREVVILSRDVDIITIPDGHQGRMQKGQEVTIHQTLGNHFTVLTDYGHLVRIAGIDADALGKESKQFNALAPEAGKSVLEENCWEVMKTIYDPEIPVNIVDLGLVYGCTVTPNPAAGHDVQVSMTLTAPGCGMGAVIQNDVENSIKALPGVTSVNVEIVLDPPWSRDMMSELAQLQLGLF